MPLRDRAATLTTGARRAFPIAFVGLLVAVLAACSSGPGKGGDLTASQWNLKSYIANGAQTAMPDGVFADLAFDRNTASGFNGCNDFSGGFTQNGSNLSFGQFASTLMACEGPANDVATAFMAALGTTNQYTATQTDLTLYDKNGTILALFLAEPANPLVGGDWKIDAYLDANGAVVTPVKDSDPTVTFMAAEQLSGTTGCNDFTGGYRISGTTILIGRMALHSEGLPRRPRRPGESDHRRTRWCRHVQCQGRSPRPARPPGPIRPRRGAGRRAERLAIIEPERVAEPEPLAESEPVAEPEPNAKPVAAAQPQPVSTAKPVAAAEPVAGRESLAVSAAEPVAGRRVPRQAPPSPPAFSRTVARRSGCRAVRRGRHDRPRHHSREPAGGSRRPAA